MIHAYSVLQYKFVFIAQMNAGDFCQQVHFSVRFIVRGLSVKLVALILKIETLFRMHCKMVFNVALHHDLALLQDNRLLA